MTLIKNGIAHITGIAFFPETIEVTAGTNKLTLGRKSSSIKLDNTSDGVITVRGIDFVDEEADGSEHVYNIKVISDNGIILKHNDAAAAVGDKMFLKGSVDITLNKGDTITLMAQDDASGKGFFEFSYWNGLA